ncbi:hypothetical protein [Neisseria chenwenguii]|nr:hypothetical protein [Neisseria chenwenguii]
MTSVERLTVSDGIMPSENRKGRLKTHIGFPDGLLFKRLRF